MHNAQEVWGEDWRYRHILVGPVVTLQNTSCYEYMPISFL